MHPLPFTQLRHQCAYHSLQTLNFLAVLEMAGKGHGITKTAKELNISRTAIVLALNAMEYAGLLVKERATEGDKRTAVIRMTPEGVKMLEQIERIFIQSTPDSVQSAAAL